MLYKLLIVVVMLGVSALASFVDNVQSEPPATLAVAYMPAPLNAPAILEKQRGVFEQAFAQEDIAVSYPEMATGQQLVAALRAGTVQFAHGLDAASFVTAAASGMDVKVIGVCSRAPQALVLLAQNPAIQKLEDARGMAVALPDDVSLQRLFAAALAEKKLRADELQVRHMSVNAGIDALRKGEVALTLASGPDALRAIQGGARVLLSGEGLVDGLELSVVTGEFLENHPMLVKRFMAAHRDTIEYMVENPPRAQERVAQERGMNEEDVHMLLPWYNYDFTVHDADMEELKHLQAFLQAAGTIQKPVDVNALLADVAR